MTEEVLDRDTERKLYLFKLAGLLWWAGAKPPQNEARILTNPDYAGDPYAAGDIARDLAEKIDWEKLPTSVLRERSRRAKRPEWARKGRVAVFHLWMWWTRLWHDLRVWWHERQHGETKRAAGVKLIAGDTVFFRHENSENKHLGRFIDYSLDGRALVMENGRRYLVDSASIYPGPPLTLWAKEDF